jgi:hypothetical protein
VNGRFAPEAVGPATDRAKVPKTRKQMPKSTAVNKAIKIAIDLSN